MALWFFQTKPSSNPSKAFADNIISAIPTNNPPPPEITNIQITDGPINNLSPTPNPIPAGIKVLSPNGGEKIGIGSTYRITWEAENVQNLWLGYSFDPNHGDWIATNIPNTGYFDWNVFIGYNNNNRNVKIFLSGYKPGVGSVYDESDNFFEVISPTPTLTPSPTPTLIQFPIYTPTPTMTITPPNTSTPVPTKTLILTPTPIPTTKFYLSLTLEGVGTGSARFNKNPLHKNRNVALQVFDNSNKFVAEKTGIVSYKADKGTFEGRIDLGIVLVKGDYSLKLKTDKYLKKQISGIQIGASGINSSNTDPGAIIIIIIERIYKAYLTVGDINGDNKITFLDFSEFRLCYNRTTDKCLNKADLNDDGKINEVDYYNFLLKNFNKTGN